MTEPRLSDTSSPTAAFKIDVAGAEFTQQSAGSLMSFVVETHLDKIGRAELTIGGDGATEPRGLNIGDEVKVSVGGDARQAFQGNITELTYIHSHGKDAVVILAMDPLVKLAASNETKHWGGEPSDALKDSTLAQEVIGRGATAGTVDETSGERPYVLQRAESNLRFLKRLAARNGYLVYAEEGKVHFKKPQFTDDPQEIGAADLLELDTTRSDIGIPQKVQVHGWDYVAKEAVSGELASSGVATIGSGDAPASVTWAGDHHIVDVFVKSTAGATGMAGGVMEQMARQFVTGRCTVNGNGALYPGARVKFAEGFTNYNADGVVVGARHVWEDGGVMTTTIWFVGNTAPS